MGAFDAEEGRLHSMGRAIALIALAASTAAGCVTPNETYTPLGAASTSSGGTTGAGGGSPALESATETVNAGTVATNGQFRMVFTLGQPALSQQTSKATGLRLQGGLTGATESTP
jgi:hypothetical protein